MNSVIEAFRAVIGTRLNLAEKAAVMTCDGRIVAITAPGAAASLAKSIDSVRQFFKDRWRQGDVAVLNDPDRGATHVCQVTAVAARYKGASIEGWVVLRCNGIDFGGWNPGGYSPQAVDRWAEGARFEPAKLLVAGTVRREVADLLALNSRTPNMTRKLALQLAEHALQLSKMGNLAELEARYETEAQMARKAISALPASEAESSVAIRAPSDWKSPGQVSVRVSQSGGRLNFDVSAPPTSARPLNLCEPASLDIVVCAALQALQLEAMRTGALMPFLNIHLGGMLAASLPACVGMGRETSGTALLSACEQALAAVVRRRSTDTAQSWLRAEVAGAFDWSTGRLTADAVSALLATEPGVHR